MRDPASLQPGIHDGYVVEHPKLNGRTPPEAQKTVLGWKSKLVDPSTLYRTNFPDLKWLIPGLIPEGVTLVASRPKLGKSFLFLQIGGAVANGLSTLVSNGAPPHGDVLYLALEDSERRMKRRLRILYGENEEAWPTKRLKFMFEWRRLDQGGLEDLEEWCRSVDEPTLILIDTLKRVRPPHGNYETDYDADYRSCQGLQQLAARVAGLSIPASHHDRKADAEDVFDTVSGTLGLTAAVDSIAILKRKGNGKDAPVTLHIEGRDLEEEVAKAVKFDKETCRWIILGEAAEVQRSAERSRILAVLRSASEGLTVAEIVARASLVSRDAAYQMLGRMSEDGAVERIKQGLYGLPGTKARMEAAARAKRRFRKSDSSDSPKNTESDSITPMNGHGKSDQSDDLTDFYVGGGDATVDKNGQIVRSEPTTLQDQDDSQSDSDFSAESDRQIDGTDDDITPLDQLHLRREFQ
jgi:hypothetical protein